MDGALLPQRVIDPDGHAVEAFPLPAEEAALAAILRDLFQDHWQEIVFGPIIEGAAWEWRAPQAPTYVGVLDGYITVAFGAPHFHLCIGPTKGTRSDPTPEALARRRRCARAELFRRLDRDGAPVAWGLRLFNGAGEQQMTAFFPNPLLSADGARALAEPDWSRLALWDEMRARHLGLTVPDPSDRSAKAFRHG
jgi:hypothetical protein